MLKELAYRPATSVKDIQFDNNGHPTKIIQSAIQADGTVVDKDLDITKCLVFTHGRKGGNIRGKSLLRTAYPHWFYKTHMYKIDAIQKQRHALGVPKGKLLPGSTQDDKKALRNLLRNISANEESFMVLTPNVEVEFAEMKSQLVNVLESADHHNIMILLNVMAQFLALGIDGHGGGRATGGAQTDIFMKSLRYIMNLVCDIINMHLVPELVVYNFPTNNFPKLRVRNIGETRDLQMFGSALANMVTAGGLTMDIETENWFRRVFDIPPKNADAEVLPGHTKTAASNPVEAVPQKGAVKPGGNGKGSGNVPKPSNAP
jgi:phage gp29-like protein